MEHTIKNDALEDIKLELYRTDTLYSQFEFSCFSENIITYKLEENHVLHEISIINDKRSFFNKEKAVDLLNRNGLLFISHSVYLKDEKENHQNIGSRTYAPLLDEYDDKKEETGYTTKDGVMLYVGDIINEKETTKPPALVVKRNHNFQDSFDMINSSNANHPLDFYFNESDKNNYDYYVLGNIYDLDKNELLNFMNNMFFD